MKDILRRRGLFFGKPYEPHVPDYFEQSLELHRKLQGKIEVRSKCQLDNLQDLSVAYSPGVAAASEAIAQCPDEARLLTTKGNSVAIVTDGSAVLGLGDIGPVAALPVMEGKALLFRELAGLDAWPICVDSKDTNDIVQTVRMIAPTFGAVNLEDIAAPRCFEIESQLQDLGIPVMHDDQHGTAIVVFAGLMNAARVVGKSVSELQVVINGAGAAGVAIAKLLTCLDHVGGECLSVGNVIVCDSQGAIHSGRTGLSTVKQELLKFTNQNNESGQLAEAVRNKDVFIGVSKGDLLTHRHVASMNSQAIVFGLANPVPEILPEEALRGGAAIVATGRSDYPNQLNNVLAFPGIFRGALDAQSPAITTQMKLAAAKALASSVPAPTADRLLPTPLERAVTRTVAAAVAKAAPKS